MLILYPVIYVYKSNSIAIHLNQAFGLVASDHTYKVYIGAHYSPAHSNGQVTLELLTGHTAMARHLIIEIIYNF